MTGNLFRRATNHNQRVNKKQNIEIYSPASSGGKWKYKKYVSFPWSPFEAILSILNISFFFCYKNIFEKELLNQRRMPSMPNHRLYKNVCFEQIRSLFQQIMMSKTVALVVRPRTSDAEIWASQGKEQFEPEAQKNLILRGECLPHFCSFLKETSFTWYISVPGACTLPGL